MVKVRVVVAGIYNGEGHKGLGYCYPRQVIEVPSGWYVESLERDGLVEQIESDEPDELNEPDTRLSLLPGIGPQTLAALAEHGIHSPADLVAHDAANIAAFLPRVSLGRVRQWQIAAQRFL